MTNQIMCSCKILGRVPTFQRAAWPAPLGYVTQVAEDAWDAASGPVDSI